jgi:uncharacterized protein YkwD
MMKKMILAACLTALSACGSALIVPVSSGGQLGYSETAGRVVPPTVTTNDANFGEILNNLRISNNLGTVSYDSRLDAAAQAHAEDMATNNYFSHVSQDGRTALDRIRETGYRPVAYGENIAGRQQSDSEVLTAWINSPRHNEILNVGRFEDFALGVAGEGSMTRWVLLMGQE